MKLIQRVGYYLGGFSIGLILLAFFLSGKNVSCDYSPNARVLKNINTKRIVYSQAASQSLISHQLDSLTISNVLKQGNVNFSKSDTKLEFCKIYVIEEAYNDKEIALTVENCKQKAIIKTIEIY